MVFDILFYCVTMHTLQLTLNGLGDYEQHEPWTTTNEDNKTPFLFAYFPYKIAASIKTALLGETKNFAYRVAGEKLGTSYQSKPRC